MLLWGSKVTTIFCRRGLRCPSANRSGLYKWLTAVALLAECIQEHEDDWCKERKALPLADLHIFYRQPNLLWAIHTQVIQYKTKGDFSSPEPEWCHVHSSFFCCFTPFFFFFFNPSAQKWRWYVTTVTICFSTVQHSVTRIWPRKNGLFFICSLVVTCTLSSSAIMFV